MSELSAEFADEAADEWLPPIGNYDSPWKDLLDSHFREFMAFFFPHAHDDIDWAQGYEFLDKELQEVAIETETGRRYVDKLVSVYRQVGGANPEEAWVLVHIEVQGQRDAKFAERMYIYNGRLYDRYKKQVASLAVLTDDSPSWRPSRFEYEL